MDKKKIWDNYKFPLILLGGIIIGAIVGLVMGRRRLFLSLWVRSS